MPFIGATVVKDFALMIEDDAFDLGLNLETLRYVSETINDGLQRFLANRRRLRCAAVFRLKNRRRFPEPGFFAGPLLFDGADFVSRHLKPQRKLGFQRGGVVFA